MLYTSICSQGKDSRSRPENQWFHFYATCCQGQFDKYKGDLEAMEANPCHQPTLVLYFKMPVKEALLRIKKRARFFEKDIEENYMKLLEAEYETHYKNREDWDRVEPNMFSMFCATWFWVSRHGLSPQLGGCGWVVIAIDSTMSADEIKKKVADHLHDNKARYCEVLKKKGYPESQARKLLTLMISFFSN